MKKLATLTFLRDARATELEGEGAGEAGFTLIELMVVLLIIAILLAIAIPTFLGVTGGANDRAAQSNLTNAVTEASAIYQNNNQAYPAAAAGFTAQAPEFAWSTGACTKATTNCVSFATSADGQAVLLADFSPANSGKCWYALVSPNEAPTVAAAQLYGGAGGITLTTPTGGPGTYYDYVANQTSCTADVAAAASFANWSATYGAASATAGS